MDSPLADRSMTPSGPTATLGSCTQWCFGRIWEAAGVCTEIWAVFIPAV